MRPAMATMGACYRIAGPVQSPRAPRAASTIAAVLPAGHVASAWLLARRSGNEGGTLYVLFGTLLPDLIDKPQIWLGITPFGRSIGHAALFWGVATLLCALQLRLRTGPSLLVVIGGYLHLLVDLADDVVEGFERSGYAFSAWIGWPVTDPDMHQWRVAHLFPRELGHTTSLELATVAFALAVAARFGRVLPSRPWS